MTHLKKEAIEAIKKDLARKGVELTTIEYYEVEYDYVDHKEVWQTEVFNGLYTASLMHGNGRWLDWRYTTNKNAKAVVEYIKAKQKILNYEKVEVRA